MKKTDKTMELLKDGCGKVFSKSEILARDEVFKFAEGTKSNKEYSDNNVRKVIHELFSIYAVPIKVIELKTIYEMLMGHNDTTENAGYYYNEELVRGA